MRLLIATVFGAACALACPGAAAQNWVGLLKNAPAQYFDDEDLRLFLDAARKTLDGQAPENQPVSWENPKTRHRGELTVLKSFESNGRPCKEVRVKNEAQGRKSDSRASLCSIDGRWKLLSASQLKEK